MTITAAVLALCGGPEKVWLGIRDAVNALPRPRNRSAVEDSEPVPEIPPHDPMVLCPACGLMGYHSLDEMARGANRMRELPNGDVVEIYAWAGGVRAHYRRECVFCEHVWAVPIPAQP